MEKEKMTPALLKAHVQETNSDSFYFTRDTMRFFGDSMSNYAVSREPVRFRDYTGELVTAWELRRKRPVKHGLRAPAYFDVVTFRKVSRPDQPVPAPAVELTCEACGEGFALSEIEATDVTTTAHQWQCPCCGSWEPRPAAATPRYAAKQSDGFHWVVLDRTTGFESMADSPAAAKRLAKALNARA